MRSEWHFLHSHQHQKDKQCKSLDYVCKEIKGRVECKGQHVPAQVICIKFCISNFLKTLLWKVRVKVMRVRKNPKMGCTLSSTKLFETRRVRRALFWELIATFSVTTCSRSSSAWITVCKYWFLCINQVSHSTTPKKERTEVPKQN